MVATLPYVVVNQFTYYLENIMQALLESLTEYQLNNVAYVLDTDIEVDMADELIRQGYKEEDILDLVEGRWVFNQDDFEYPAY